MSKHYCLAIDPANIESGWVLMDAVTYEPIAFNKTPNEDFRDMIYAGRFEGVDDYVEIEGSDECVVAIEMVASYGMPVGREVFETCVWIGRLMEACIKARHGYAHLYENPELVYRKNVKTHLCGHTNAKDANVRQALIDRFAKTARGKGTKKEPDWFYGFRADMWQAYAVGVTYLDWIHAKEPEVICATPSLEREEIKR